MPGSEEAPSQESTITDWRTESRFYRRKPGAGWLVAFLAVPALLALIGFAGTDRSGDSGELVMPSIDPSATMTAPETPTATAGAPTASPDHQGFPPFSIVRAGNAYTITGEFPDEASKKGLLDSLKLVLPGATINDELTVSPGVRMPDVASLGGLFSAIVGIPDFALKLDGGTLTLTGTAPAEAIKASAGDYAQKAWPNVNVVNDIQVRAAGTPPAAAPPPAAPPAAPAPPAPGGGACATLQADISALLRTPINFLTNGFSLTPQSQQLVQQIADQVKACPSAKLVVIGHTDDTGNDAINVPLSASRAKAVADELVSDGVAAGSVTSRGEGSSKPIASNATPDGRAQNRRTEITVS